MNAAEAGPSRLGGVLVFNDLDLSHNFNLLYNFRRHHLLGSRLRELGG